MFAVLPFLPSRSREMFKVGLGDAGEADKMLLIPSHSVTLVLLNMCFCMHHAYLKAKEAKESISSSQRTCLLPGHDNSKYNLLFESERNAMKRQSIR